MDVSQMAIQPRQPSFVAHRAVKVSLKPAGREGEEKAELRFVLHPMSAVGFNLTLDFRPQSEVYGPAEMFELLTFTTRLLHETR
ncbi:hypothetical protein MHYP_G00172680 [Metynnis hypsauchen]